MGNERDSHIGVLFNPREKKVSACQFDVNDITTKQTLVLSDTKLIPFLFQFLVWCSKG